MTPGWWARPSGPRLRLALAGAIDRAMARVVPAAPYPTARPLRRPLLVGIVLFVCVLSGYLFSFNVDQPAHNGDWYLRYQVTCSIVEHNRFWFHPYQSDARTGRGVDGHTYAQYTLGQSTAMIPLYLLGRALAGVSHTNCDAPVAPPEVFLTAKALDLIVGALLCVLFFNTALLLGYAEMVALALTALLAFGSSLWPDVLSNLEHTQESLFLLVAVYAALRYAFGGLRVRLWVVVMGLAAGLVFVTRIAGIIVLPVFPLFLAVLHRRDGAAWRRPLLRDLGLYAMGAAPSLAINLAYDALRFGSPLQTAPLPDHSFGYPPWLGLPELLVSPGKGLIWYTPALLLLLPAARPFWRRLPLPALLFGLIGTVYLLFYANVMYWHGDPAWGPRYLFALLPYGILPLGEVLQRWRGYRAGVRRVLVAVLALSFLVQVTAATVSYWRHFHYIFGYYHGQVMRYVWGWDMHYWWNIQQSPIVYSLEGIADIARTLVSHPPLLEHDAAQRYASGNDSCVFRVYGRASICLTDADDLRFRANWNAYALWWLHSYPWWSADTEAALAGSVAAVFLLSGGALVVLLSGSDRAARRRAPPRSRRGAAPIAATGSAALLALLIYGGIAGAGAASAPRRAAPLIRRVVMGTLVYDDGWSYRVVRVLRVQYLGSDRRRAPRGYRYALVELELRNLTQRSNSVRRQYFALTDSSGHDWPHTAPALDGLAARVLHLAPAWAAVPAFKEALRALVYLVNGNARHLALLGPGIVLTQLTRETIVEPGRLGDAHAHAQRYGAPTEANGPPAVAPHQTATAHTASNATPTYNDAPPEPRNSRLHLK